MHLINSGEDHKSSFLDFFIVLLENLTPLFKHFQDGALTIQIYFSYFANHAANIFIWWKSDAESQDEL